eukprot:Nitzschia sp. Nitz4//scaffold19_size178191//90291//90686//NITZ4_001979-RB/size178191-exonerate_est2genome-gene-0.6-mRNA-2//1//CDS//3329540687//3598//frame0
MQSSDGSNNQFYGNSASTRMSTPQSYGVMPQQSSTFEQSINFGDAMWNTSAPVSDYNSSGTDQIVQQDFNTVLNRQQLQQQELGRFPGIYPDTRGRGSDPNQGNPSL